MRTRMVVVGGGVAGLVAATELARAGLAPVLLEAGAELGGRAQTRVLDGCCFNQGPHALYVGGALNAALAEYGVAAKGGRPDFSDALGLWDEGEHPLPFGRVGDVAPLDAAESAALAGLMRRIVRGDYDGRGQPLATVIADLPGRVRLAIRAYARLTTYVDAPDLIDAKAAFDQVRLSFGGVLYLDDGWSSLVAGLASAAREAGAELRTECTVSGVMRDEARWRVALAGGDAIGCDAVILAVGPGEAAALVGSKALAAAVPALRPARLVGLDLALSPGVTPRTTFALGMDAPTYLSVHSAAARLAPPGWALAHLARYLAPDEAPTAAMLGELEGAADRLLQGWRRCEAHRQRLLGLTVTHAVPEWRDRGRRMDGRVADAPGLFLSGDWVGEVGMLADAAAASARAASRAAQAFVAAVPERAAGRTI
jgi:phytoene dehydrogenase-like protein